MIAYHVDRLGSLQVGQTISGFNDDNIFNLSAISHWGRAIIDSPKSSFFDASDINTYNIEIHAEAIRKRFFPEMISRFSAFFAVPSLDILSSWKSVLNYSDKSTIYEISFSNRSHLLDGRFLNQNFSQMHSTENPLEFFDEILEAENELYNYWSGVFSADSLPELLIEFPVTIERII